ncbi:MAG TPA: MFS transporter [Stellaceae bacterium]|jgi:MHS family proline/betaine transporter-like MFS transporter
MAVDAAIAGGYQKKTSLGRVLLAATIGNVLEWFDFLVYGYFAVTIAQVFFPVANPTVSLLITFAAFGLSYVVRPLGAIFIGAYTDKRGRKAGLTLSIALMMVGTILMCVTPSFATIGLAAPVIITGARLLQGFSVGGEFGSAVAFLVEHGSDRKGYAASWQWASTGIISVIVALFGIAVTTTLSHDQIVEWGWRVPYFFGLLVGPAGLYIRSKMEETPAYLGSRREKAPVRELLRDHPRAVVLAMGAAVISNSSYYLLLYIPTYGIKQLHLSAATGFIATLVGGVFLAVFSPIAGYISDGTARTRLMKITGWLFLLTSYPVFWIMHSWPSLATAMLAVGWLNLIKAGYSGILPSLLSEQFPVDTRAVGVAFSYSVSVTIFGGFAPLVATWLIASTGDPLSPAYYLMFSALLSLIALAVISRRPAVQ